MDLVRQTPVKIFGNQCYKVSIFHIRHQEVILVSKWTAETYIALEKIVSVLLVDIIYDQHLRKTEWMQCDLNIC